MLSLYLCVKLWDDFFGAKPGSLSIPTQLVDLCDEMVCKTGIPGEELTYHVQYIPPSCGTLT